MRNGFVQTLGNLTILTTGLNSAQSNLAWKQKKPELLKHSLLPINQALAEVAEWNESTIAARGEALLAKATKIWSR